MCPLSGLGALRDVGQSLAGSPRRVFSAKETGMPILFSTSTSSTRKTVSRGLADSCIGRASSPSPVKASHCARSCTSSRLRIQLRTDRKTVSQGFFFEDARDCAKSENEISCEAGINNQKNKKTRNMKQPVQKPYAGKNNVSLQ